ncbi:hypothetical protein YASMINEVIRUS_1016 [Yasminevirus sp. GU-2018]|uniref:Uncharacterized protein n=1 Tax=Yasminevirus sp. GU-2018 TaxID=2420051 RepID=A0A5K0UAR1_9VIRU|nr:hypothetical protein YASMINEVIRUS_1016 [Yasminevirus sp. GU-2018]
MELDSNSSFTESRQNKEDTRSVKKSLLKFSRRRDQSDEHSSMSRYGALTDDVVVDDISPLVLDGYSKQNPKTKPSSRPSSSKMMRVVSSSLPQSIPSLSKSYVQSPIQSPIQTPIKSPIKSPLKTALKSSRSSVPFDNKAYLYSKSNSSTDSFGSTVAQKSEKEKEEVQVTEIIHEIDVDKDIDTVVDIGDGVYSIMTINKMYSLSKVGLDGKYKQDRILFESLQHLYGFESYPINPINALYTFQRKMTKTKYFKLIVMNLVGMVNDPAYYDTFINIVSTQRSKQLSHEKFKECIVDTSLQDAQSLQASSLEEIAIKSPKLNSTPYAKRLAPVRDCLGVSPKVHKLFIDEIARLERFIKDCKASPATLFSVSSINDKLEIMSHVGTCVVAVNALTSGVFVAKSIDRANALVNDLFSVVEPFITNTTKTLFTFLKAYIVVRTTDSKTKTEDTILSTVRDFVQKGFLAIDRMYAYYMLFDNSSDTAQPDKQDREAKNIINLHMPFVVTEKDMSQLENILDMIASNYDDMTTIDRPLSDTKSHSNDSASSIDISIDIETVLSNSLGIVTLGNKIIDYEGLFMYCMYYYKRLGSLPSTQISSIYRHKIKTYFNLLRRQGYSGVLLCLANMYGYGFFGERIDTIRALKYLDEYLELTESTTKQSLRINSQLGLPLLNMVDVNRSTLELMITMLKADVTFAGGLYTEASKHYTTIVNSLQNVTSQDNRNVLNDIICKILYINLFAHKNYSPKSVNKSFMLNVNGVVIDLVTHTVSDAIYALSTINTVESNVLLGMICEEYDQTGVENSARALTKASRFYENAVKLGQRYRLVNLDVKSTSDQMYFSTETNNPIGTTVALYRLGKIKMRQGDTLSGVIYLQMAKNLGDQSAKHFLIKNQMILEQMVEK